MLDDGLIKQISSINGLGKISEIKLEKPDKSGGRKFTVVVNNITFKHVDFVVRKKLSSQVTHAVKKDTTNRLRLSSETSKQLATVKHEAEGAYRKLASKRPIKTGHKKT